MNGPRSGHEVAKKMREWESYSTDCLGKNMLLKFELEARLGKSRGYLLREMFQLSTTMNLKVFL